MSVSLDLIFPIDAGFGVNDCFEYKIQFNLISGKYLVTRKRGCWKQALNKLRAPSNWHSLLDYTKPLINYL